MGGHLEGHLDFRGGTQKFLTKAFFIIYGVDQLMLRESVRFFFFILFFSVCFLLLKVVIILINSNCNGPKKMIAGND